MPASVVCISRTEGALGREIGNLVASTLGFRCVDEEIVARAAEIGGITESDVVSEEQRKSALGRIMEAIGRGAAADTGLVPSEEPTEAIRSLILEAIDQTASEGRVVIVAHAASHALAGRDDVLRVLVTASPQTRVRRVAEESGVDVDAAQRSIRQNDAARAYYLSRFYGVEAELPTHYDLVVNTDAVSSEQAAATITHLAR